MARRASVTSEHRAVPWCRTAAGAPGAPFAWSLRRRETVCVAGSDESVSAAADLIGLIVGGATLADHPQRLDGGRSAEIFRFRLTEGPNDLRGRELVLRLLPDTASSLAEAVIQAEVANLGFATPPIHRLGSVDGRHYSIMDHVAGTTLFDADRLGALRRIPDQLADLMASLHDLDSAPVKDALAARGATAACDAQSVTLDDIDAGLRMTDDTYRPVRHWLDAHQPPVTREVVCHGDLHALNILTNGGLAVIDWEIAAVGDPAFDVARTKLLMMAVPMELPRLARPLIQRLGRIAGARFQRAYLARAPMSPSLIGWYGVLHATRIAVKVMVATHQPERSNPVVAGWARPCPS